MIVAATILNGGYTATAQDFYTTMTGDMNQNQEYVNARVMNNGIYTFSEKSAIKTKDANGTDFINAVRIDAPNGLDFDTTNSGQDSLHSIGVNSFDEVNINAKTLNIKAKSSNGRIEGINVGSQGKETKDTKYQLKINGDTNINVQGIGYTLGLYATGNSCVTFNGNVRAFGENEQEWGLTSKNGAWGYYGCSFIYSGSNYKLQMGPKVTVNGNVYATIDGNGLFGNGGNAKLTINGGGYIEINKDNKHNYYALLSECATASLNVVLDENYKATAARNNKLILKGNISASTGALNVKEPERYTYVNLGLATKDSEWTGVAYNKFNDDGNLPQGAKEKYYGEINLFLQNGAIWNNEEWGAVETNAWNAEPFTGSRITYFEGGKDDKDDMVGKIYQNDKRDINIDKYVGYAHVYYRSEKAAQKDGKPSFAEAGNINIKEAKSGSGIKAYMDLMGVNPSDKSRMKEILWRKVSCKEGNNHLNKKVDFVNTFPEVYYGERDSHDRKDNLISESPTLPNGEEANYFHDIIYLMSKGPHTIATTDNYTADGDEIEYRVFYTHDNKDGLETSDYTEGDTTIESAYKGARITVLTENTGKLNLRDKDNVNDDDYGTRILSALAGKIFYKGKWEEIGNITVRAMITEGLTDIMDHFMDINMIINPDCSGALNFDKEKGGQGYLDKSTVRMPPERKGGLEQAAEAMYQKWKKEQETKGNNKTSYDDFLNTFVGKPGPKSGLEQAAEAMYQKWKKRTRS